MLFDRGSNQTLGSILMAITLQVPGREISVEIVNGRNRSSHFKMVAVFTYIESVIISRTNNSLLFIFKACRTKAVE